jgi:hypothetical protein
MANGFRLYTGKVIPAVGLGTWKLLDHEAAKHAVHTALLEAGYTCVCRTSPLEKAIENPTYGYELTGEDRFCACSIHDNAFAQAFVQHAYSTGFLPI